MFSARSYTYYWWAGLLLALCVIVTVRLVDGIYHNNRTTDESAHVATGMEWLERHTYYMEELHPPLARVLISLPLYLEGVHMKEKKFNKPCTTPFPVYYEKMMASHVKGYFTSRCWNTGDLKLLYHGNYLKNLHLARIAGVAWMLLGALYLYALTIQLSNRETALAAVFVWTMLPLALAHAGLATTDLPAAVAVTMAMTHALKWITEKTKKNALLLGAAFAVCGLVKFSALVYAGALFTPLLLWSGIQHTKNASLPSFLAPLFLHGALAFLVMFLLVWAGYRFNVGSLADVFPFAYHAVSTAPGNLLATISAAHFLPMPEWFMGWLSASLKNAKGHATYVLGTPLKDVGVWYFFPVALWFKTPLSMWALTSAALILGIRRKQSWLLWPALWCLTILGISMTSNINLGARHILPLFPFLCIIAAGGGVLLWRSSNVGQVLSFFLFGWLAIASLTAHPRYIPFFNSTAGNHPQHILVDSDLAWGQDFALLVHELIRRDLHNVDVCSSDFGRFKNFHLDIRHRVNRVCPPAPPKDGWLVINYNMYFSTEAERMAWLGRYYPVAKIGDSYELYHFGK